jgi:hypothetical protein
MCGSRKHQCEHRPSSRRRLTCAGGGAGLGAVGQVMGIEVDFVNLRAEVTASTRRREPLSGGGLRRAPTGSTVARELYAIAGSGDHQGPSRQKSVD